MTQTDPLAQAAVGGAPRLDASQARAAAAALDGGAVVFGAPGSGKTTLALAAVEQVKRAGLKPLLIAPSRAMASELRDQLMPRLGATSGPAARTIVSLAYQLLTERDGTRPVLVTGPEQDAMLAQIIDDELIGRVPPIGWPEQIPPATRTLRAFRAEVRDTLMRCAEFGIDPEQLAEWAKEHHRPAWKPLAELYRRYRDGLIMRSIGAADAPVSYDSSEVVAAAVGAVRDLGESGAPPAWDVLVVDDAHEATAAAWRLLRAIADGGTRLVLIGDPDVAAQGFRGAQPVLLARAADPAPEGLGLPAFDLAGRYRLSGAVGAAVARTVGYIRPAGHASHRFRPADPEAAGAAPGVAGEAAPRVAGGAAPGVAGEAAPRVAGEAAPGVAGEAAVGGAPGKSRTTVAIGSSRSDECARVARWLREAHLSDGLAWSELAVVARSAGEVEAMRDHLALAGIPVTVPGAQLPLAAEPAVRPFLLALRVVTDGLDTLSPQVAETLLASPIGAADALDRRRLRRALRRAEIAAGGARTSDELLVEALTIPGALATIHQGDAAPAVRLARVLAAGAAAMTPGAQATDVLWAMWQASGRAEAWQRDALAQERASRRTGRGAGPSADLADRHLEPPSRRADRNLDAVMALFRLAEIFAEREPIGGVARFVEHLGSQDLPADRIAAHAPIGDAVTVTTATAAVGSQWRRVAVVGVQDGTWPDLRLRDTLLGAQQLTDIALGRWAGGPPDLIEARRQVLDDELRTFALAVSRAREELLVTAVVSEDERPSEFVSLVDEDAELAHAASDLGATPIDLPALVAQLRRDVVGTDDAVAEQAAVLLAHLADQNVAGADPSDWYGLEPIDDGRPTWPADALVSLSPSRIEQLITCPLRWLLESSGGNEGTSQAQSLGTLIHAVAEALPQGSASDLAAEFDRLWPGLGLPDGWLARREHDRARAMVDRLAGYLEAHPAALGTEQSFAFELPGARIAGRIDRIEDGADGAIIVDFKTAKTPISKADARVNPQLTVYQLAGEAGGLELGGKPLAGARLVYLGSGNDAPVREQAPLGDDERKTALATMAQAASLARGPGFDAIVNDRCRTCPVRRSCPLGGVGQVICR